MKKLVTLVLVCISFAVISCGKTATNKNEPDKELKPISLVFTGAHPPGGGRGAANDFYFWSWESGPVSTCEAPEFYDVNTGKLVMKNPNTYVQVKVFGKYIALISKLDMEKGETDNITYVFEGNRMLFEETSSLLFVDDASYCIKQNDEVVFRKTGNQALLESITVGKGMIALDAEEFPGKIILFSDASSIVIEAKTRRILLEVPFSIGFHPEKKSLIIKDGFLYELDLTVPKLDKIKPTVCGNGLQALNHDRAFDFQKSELYDINTGEKIAYLDGYQYGEISNGMLVFTSEQKVIVAYSLTNGRMLWKLGTNGFSMAFMYGDKIIYSTFGSDEVVCIDASNGNKLWNSDKFSLGYYSSFFYGNTAYDYINDNKDKGRLIQVDLDTGEIILEIESDEMALVDPTNEVYYTKSHKESPSKHALDNIEKIW